LLSVPLLGGLATDTRSALVLTIKTYNSYGILQLFIDQLLISDLLETSSLFNQPSSDCRQFKIIFNLPQLNLSPINSQSTISTAMRNSKFPNHLNLLQVTSIIIKLCRFPKPPSDWKFAISNFVNSKHEFPIEISKSIPSCR
jgi:hypothetical protein